MRTPDKVLVVVVLLVAALAAGMFVSDPSMPGTRLTAIYPTAVGVYEGSDVRVLGVRVGQIDAVRPEGEAVIVTLTVDAGIKIPADAKAVVVAPSLVADRYVQLAPVYEGGPEMKTGTVLSKEDTASPAELDQVYDALRQFSEALGPDGVNKDGALSKAIDVGAENLDGNGELFNTTIAELGKATRTLRGGSEDFFGTVKELGKFSSMLKNNDKDVAKSIKQLKEVNEILAADRDEFAKVLPLLTKALKELRDFLRKYRKPLKGSVGKLAKVTQTLVDQRESLAEALDVTPLVAGNLANAYDPGTGAIVGRGNLLEIQAAFGKGTPEPNFETAAVVQPPTSTICATAASPQLKRLCEQRDAGELKPGPKADGLPLPFPPTGPVYQNQGGGK